MKDTVLSILSLKEHNEKYLFEAIRELSPPPENEHFYSRLLELFVHLAVEEEEARGHWDGILENYEYLNRKLDHDVGIRVAILDYFLNLNKKLKSPIMVEIHLFKETEKLAMIDGLTSLFNRRYFDVSIKKELKRAARYDKNISLLMVDIDNFKQLNDTRGHLFGDEVLKRLARLLKQITREEDIVCRYGGEEFVILLPETTADGSIAFTERMRKTMRGDSFFREHAITVSGGIAAYPFAGSTAEDLLAKADQALYEAKFSGKDRFVKSLPQNKRRRPRFDRKWNLRCRLMEKIYQEEAPIEAVTQNVSLGGLAIEINEKYILGDHLILDLDLPNGNTTVIGKIVWIREKTPGTCLYGIEFSDLKSHQRQMMMQLLPSDFYNPEKG